MRHALAGISAILLSAAATAGEEVYYKITITDGTLSIAPAPTAGRSDGRLQQIELQSFKWAAPDAEPAASEVMRKDLQAADKLGNSDIQNSGHSVLGASDKVTAGGSQTESAQATGKRVHKPFRARMYYDVPQGTGPGVLKVNARLPGCTVGKRYGGMQFAAGGKTYRLQGVRVESCGGGSSAHELNEVRFTYQKIDLN